MGRADAIPAPRIAPPGWLLLGFRLVLMVLLLIVCAPLHFVWKLIGAGRWWPRVFLSGIGMVVGIEMRREGRAQPGALLLSNHVSWLDIPALSHASGTAFVAHDGLAAFPFLKWLCEMNDTVFIARDRRSTVSGQVDQIRAAAAQSGCLTLFPEGTTSDGTDLHRFKSSLLSVIEPVPEGLVVQPVVLDYEDVPEIAWVGEEPGLDNFRRILARLRPIRLTVRFLPPLGGAELTDRKTVAAAAQRAIARHLSTPD